MAVTTFALIAALSAASVFTAMAASEKTAYSFTYEKQQVTPGEAASGALKKLGDYDKKQTLANCADSSGTATAYTYDAFDVITQKVDGKEIVKEITITKASVSTEEGLKVGDTPSKVKELYKDAKGELGCRLDRHESIGKGKLGLEAFRHIMNDPRIDNIPLTLETPDDTIWSDEIKQLQSMAD